MRFVKIKNVRYLELFFLPKFLSSGDIHVFYLLVFFFLFNTGSLVYGSFVTHYEFKRSWLWTFQSSSWIVVFVV